MVEIFHLTSSKDFIAHLLFIRRWRAPALGSLGAGLEPNNEHIRRHLQAVSPASCNQPHPVSVNKG